MNVQENILVTDKVEKELMAKLNVEEQGAIIGMNTKNIVTTFFYDEKGSAASVCNCYVPDVRILNNAIDAWTKDNIRFCGIAHSHPSNFPMLSTGDVEYARKVCCSNSMRRIIMPIVIPNEKVIWYAVDRNGNIEVLAVEKVIIGEECELKCKG